MHITALRKDLQFNREMLSLIDTLKNIAASQYHLMEKQKVRFNAFMDAFSGFFRVVNLVDVDQPLVRATSPVLGIVIVTSDSGFMGGLNQGIVRAALGAQGGLSADQTSLVVIGDKGAALLADANRTFKQFAGIGQETIYEQAVEVRDYIVEEVSEGRMGRVVIAYPMPLSFTAQTIKVIGILPCADLFDKEAETEVSRRAGWMPFLEEARNVIVESDFGDLAKHLAGVWIAAKLFEVFEDSKLAEFSARAMHLEGSLQKLEKQEKKLRHQCFKAAHELVDKGMRESFCATKNKRAKRR
jgi:ATP synthase F1 gamma subunit